MRAEVLHNALNLGEVVFRKHEVNDLNFVAVVVQMAGDIGQADGHGLGIHPAVQPVMPVGGDEQDSHSNLPRARLYTGHLAHYELPVLF